MSSNSPVLLLAPSAVPTAPIMAPLLVAKSADLRARGLMPFQPEKPSEAAAVGKALAVPSPPPATPSAPPPSPVVEAAKPASPKVVSPVVVPPVPQVANAAPIVAARPTVPAPTPTASPVAVASPVVAAAASPVRPSVAAPSMLTRATPLTPLVTTSTPTTKRAAATSTALTIAAPSPVASPKSAPSSPSSPKSSTKSSTGRWTEAEHKLFLKGLEQFPYRAWKKIATLIKTRTVVQIRTHAQKYYQKLEKEEQRMREREAQLAAQQQQQQGAASAAVAALSASAVSTPRSAVLSAPTTPAAAASASFRELSLATPLATTPSAAAASHFAVGREDADAAITFTGAAGKRKAPMRKRKSSADETSDVPSSLPKRMMKEKKFVREKTMSPKQKTVVSNGRAFGFGDAADVSSGDDCAKGSNVRSFSGLKTHPLDFDDDDDVASGATSMILDFAEEKPMEYPFTLDTALERGLAAIDHDELLQLSDDDEGMEWFASATAGEEVDLLDGQAMVDSEGAAVGGSPLELDGNAFSPLYSEEALHFVDPMPAASECSTPSPILSGSADCSDFGLSGDEADDDEDFVLDPEKFLSSYFSPRAHQNEDATDL